MNRLNLMTLGTKILSNLINFLKSLDLILPLEGQKQIHTLFFQK